VDAHLVDILEDILRRTLAPILAAVAALAAAALSATPATAASAGRVLAVRTSTPPCTPKQSKIGGDAATTFCGPATVTLKVSGKTYKYKGGYCKDFDSGEFTDITLGTLVGVNGTPNTTDNKKKPYLRMDLGVGSSSNLNLPYYGGTLLGAEGPLKWHGGVTTKGTFKSLGATPNKFSGTYDCHGVFVGS
jgi:hypothetical protein